MTFASGNRRSSCVFSSWRQRIAKYGAELIPYVTVNNSNSLISQKRTICATARIHEQKLYNYFLNHPDTIKKERRGGIHVLCKRIGAEKKNIDRIRQRRIKVCF